MSYFHWRCNVVYGTPTMYTDMLNQTDLHTFDLSSVEAGNELVCLQTFTEVFCSVSALETILDNKSSRNVTWVWLSFIVLIIVTVFL